MRTPTILVITLITMMLLTMTCVAQTAAQCKEERRLAVNACRNVLTGSLPSASCCQRARVSHASCICPAITPKVAALVDVNRFVKLVEGCGRRVPRHYKCGSITTP